MPTSGGREADVVEVFAIVGVLVLGFATLIAAILAAQSPARFIVGGRVYESCEDFVEDTHERTGLRARPKRYLKNVRFRGKLGSGRRAEIFYQRYTAGNGKSRVVLHTVHVAVQADPEVELDVTRESVFGRLGNWLGLARDVKTGDDAFDKRFWLESKTERRTKRAMGAGLKALVQRLFADYSVERLVVEDGWLQIVAQESALDTLAYDEVLELLDEAAETFDRVPILVKTLGGERRALRDPSGAVRCAYCHGEIDGSEDDLVACKRCHTVLHDDCWEELTHCPLLGCVGRHPERARTSG